MAGLQLRHSILHPAARYPIENRLHQPVLVAGDPVELAAVALARSTALYTQLIDVARVLLAEDLIHRGAHEMIAQTVQDAGLHQGPLNGQQVVASPLGPGDRAAKPVMRVFDEAPAA